MHTIFIYTYYSPSLQNTIEYSSWCCDGLLGKDYYNFSFGLEGGGEWNVSCEILHDVVTFLLDSKTQKNALVFPRIQWRN